MASQDEIVQRWVDGAGVPGARLLYERRGRMLVSRRDPRVLLSYGEHFPLAVIMAAGSNPRGWWLLNGDQRSGQTTGHQNHVRTLVRRTGLPVLILPFTALNAAGIERDSIVPVEITADREEPVRIVKYRREEFSLYQQPGAVQLPDKRWLWTGTRHVLGESVFRARWQEHLRGRTVRHRAYFLSGFDEQEGMLYFLAQLPAGERPATVADARVALRPPEVLKADAAGDMVVRQGDIFAVPDPAMTTRELPGPSRKMGRLLGTSHCATEVRMAADGSTWARGIMWHKPVNRWGGSDRPEHVRQPLGDRVTWHRVVQNTVPRARGFGGGGGRGGGGRGGDGRGGDGPPSRSWSLGGRVD